MRNGARPPCGPEPDDCREGALEALQVLLQLLEGDHAQGEDVHVRAERVSCEQRVQLRVWLAPQDRRLP